ncbi:Myb-like_DNA-binding domain-containing protein [Hexamita inflata]|uniref:Myb-like_DNA-binding domain-containing protein n=1 Tax=Hexamita inflata TaxID=28002 RepID=A0ABP1H677_9EUKA
MLQYKRDRISCVQWSESELQLLNQAHSMLGAKWGKIQKQFFPNRTSNQLRCKFNYLKRFGAENGSQSDANEQTLEIDYEPFEELIQ